MELLDLDLPDCLERWDDGSIRVSGHRVMLSQIVDFLCDGKGLEELESRFPSVPPGKLRAVLAFCLEHQKELRDFHERACKEADELRRSIGDQGPSRAELSRRMAEKTG